MRQKHLQDKKQNPQSHVAKISLTHQRLKIRTQKQNRCTREAVESPHANRRPTQRAKSARRCIKRKEPQEKRQNTGRRSRSAALIAALAPCKCRATHVRKVRNSNIVQIPREAAGRAPQETGHRAAVVLQRPPGGETQQERKPKHFSPGHHFQKGHIVKMFTSPL